ncbi:MAG: hypothetical protein LQ337_006189 [Flavoplaca oasis]|nr:MAG: hypothetical protein LQ337_006189 [Flavoplaca oasis]
MTSWWTDERINATVDRAYIIKEIGPKRLQDALHLPVSFGDGLTDDTYLDWILQKSRRCFIILNFIGVPERIFELIDKSLDDEDLPLSEEALYDLNLFGNKSETLDKKFFRQQYSVLVQELVPGGHQVFGADEVVPLEPKNSRKGSIAATSTTSDRVSVHQKLYARKKIATSGDNGIGRVHFVMHLKALQSLKHPHLVSVWSTYTQNDFSYMLLYPITDLSLRQFLNEQPKFFKNLEKQQRRETLLRWTHCLATALAYLHDNGFPHQSIRPSNVTIDSNNTIYLANFAAMNALDSGEDKGQSYRTEIYEHAAPENWRRKPSIFDTAPDKMIHPGGGRTSRRPAPSSRPVSAISSPTIFSSHRARSATTMTSSSNSSSNNARPRKTIINTFSPPERFSPEATPADVFSLCTIILHLTSLLLGHSQKTFASHRSRHNRQAGRGGAPADASFHVNLPEVGTWMERLMKDASEREKKDKKGKGTGPSFWRSVGGVVHCAEAGLRKDPTQRHTARELERKIGKYVGRALSNKNSPDELGCGCRSEDGESEKEASTNNERSKETEMPRFVEPEYGHQPKSRQQPGYGPQSDYGYHTDYRRQPDYGPDEAEKTSFLWESKYQLSITATAPPVATSSTSAAYSAIDRERRTGLIVPVRENWPLKA